MFWTTIVYDISKNGKFTIFSLTAMSWPTEVRIFTALSYILILKAFFVFVDLLLALLISCSFSALRYIHFAAFWEMLYIIAIIWLIAHLKLKLKQGVIDHASKNCLRQ